ncbi:hypothetical protein PO124_07245 [Bacillus licheniformis]|nr:hypothetical protein [Bacillus licheniformis]
MDFILLGLIFAIWQAGKGWFDHVCMHTGLDLLLWLQRRLICTMGASGCLHGIAAVYIGVSIAFGSRMIKWADERFAYRFAGGPKPDKGPQYGREHAKKSVKAGFAISSHG